MKRFNSFLAAFCITLMAVTAFAQTPDTLTPEKNARWKIGRIRDNTLRAITPQDFRNAFNSVANLAVKRVPYLTVSELRAGKADTATVVQVLTNGRVWKYKKVAGSVAADDSGAVIRNGNTRYIIDESQISPQLYGAVGDGIADDTKAIQKTINYAANVKTVVIPTGTYKCLTKVNFNQSKTRYIGENGAVLLSTADDYPFVINGTDISIENIEFKHDNTTTAFRLTLEFLPNASRILVKNCRFSGKNGRININNAGISDITISENFFNECNYGVLINSLSSDISRVTISNNHFLNVTGDAVEVNTPNVRGTGAKEIVITGNIMKRDLRYMLANGLSLGDPANQHIGHAIGSAGLSDAIISNNSIDGFYWAGIDLEDESERVVISGNKIKNNYGDAPDWVSGKAYVRDDIVKSNGFIYLAQTAGTSGVTAPNVSSGETSDGAVTWLHLIAPLNLSPSLATGINVQDGDYITITGNVCQRTGFAGLVLENRQGYAFADDLIGNTYYATITGNSFTKSINGMYIASSGKCKIVVDANVTGLNTNAGIFVKQAKDGVLISNNISSENLYGIYLDFVFAETIFANNVISGNTNAIGVSGELKGGARFNKLTGLKKVTTASGANTGPQAMFPLGVYAKGTVSLMSRSNVNHHANRVWEVTWDGTTLTQTSVYSVTSGAVGTAAIEMVGNNLACSLVNGGATGDVELSLVFDGIMLIK